MSHRGRLNVMATPSGRPAAEIFAGFEDVDPRSVLGGGDVKYHMGATGEHRGAQRPHGQHPPGLEPQPPGGGRPVAVGRVRAKQERLGDRRARARCCPIVLHGDAAFAGQGILAETLNLAEPAGLPRRRHGPRDRQQPDRLHHRAARASTPRASPPTWRGGCRSPSSTSTARTPTRWCGWRGSPSTTATPSRATWWST